VKRLTTQSDESPARSEVLLAWTFLALTLVLWVVYVLRFRVESDEPQHLHVVWGWARGMIQYRDFFDNHTPLFHMLCAPLVVLLGDRADLLVLMRLAMLPLWVLSVRCGRRWSRPPHRPSSCAWSSSAPTPCGSCCGWPRWR